MTDIQSRSNPGGTLDVYAIESSDTSLQQVRDDQQRIFDYCGPVLRPLSDAVDQHGMKAIALSKELTLLEERQRIESSTIAVQVYSDVIEHESAR